MRLSAIELENFKGIDNRQRIELRPLTLLFGPNSSGKSTVIQALHYVREVLARRNVDPDVTVAGGFPNLGGFASLIHRNELNRPLRVKLELDLSVVEIVMELPLNSGAYLDEGDFSELQVRYLVGESQERRDYAIVQAVGIELETRWSAQQAVAFVSRIDIELDGLPLVSIESGPGNGLAQLTAFNFQHPLLRPVDPVDSDDEPSANVPSPLEHLLRLVSRQNVIDPGQRPVSENDVSVGISTFFGALPNIDEPTYIDLRDPAPKKLELERTPRVLAVCRLLDELVRGPLRIVRLCLEKMTYIGPLRQVPLRGYRPQASPDEARWAQGLAAWDLLHTLRGEELIARTSHWLSDPRRLDTGYQLERLEFRRVPVPGPFAAYFLRGLQEDDISDLQVLFDELPRERRVAFRELRTGLLVEPSDIGVGLSQLVPVVVAALVEDKKLVVVEQPELHVHPAIQVGLGDLLVSAVRLADQEPLREGRLMLVETHSEHIMLRLLRRIRETTDNELPPGALPLHPEEIAVIYVELPDSGDGAGNVRFTSIRISGEGEFVDRWPRGFFEERVEEVF
jgi:predicted ATPase